MEGNNLVSDDAISRLESEVLPLVGDVGGAVDVGGEDVGLGADSRAGWLVAAISFGDLCADALDLFGRTRTAAQFKSSRYRAVAELLADKLDRKFAGHGGKAGASVIVGGFLVGVVGANKLDTLAGMSVQPDVVQPEVVPHEVVQPEVVVQSAVHVIRDVFPLR